MVRKKLGAGKDDADARASKLDDEISSQLVRFGRQIRDIRKSKKITQQEIEARTGLTSGALSKIENGERALAMASVLKIALALEMQPSELVSLLDDRKRSHTADGGVVGVPIVIGPGVSPETVRELLRELDGRAAVGSQRASSRSGK